LRAAGRLRGTGRWPHDIDLFVRPSADNVGRLRRALRSIWNDPSIDEIAAGDLAGDYPVIQYIAPDGTQIDLLSRLGTEFAFDDLRSRVYAYGDVEVVVATAESCSCTTAADYWSSTSNANVPINAWRVDFFGGFGRSGDKTGGNFVRAVRGGS